MGDGRRVERRADHHERRGHRPAAAFGGEGDGGPATAARLGYANDVELAADGSVLVAEITATNIGRIRRVRPDGVIETYVSGIASPPRDRARARREPLRHAPYVPNDGHGRCGSRPTGRSATFAGGGTRRRRRPGHQRALPLPIEVAAAPDGSVYITNGNTRQAGRARTGSSRPSPAATSASRSATAARRRRAAGLHRRPRRRPRRRALHRPQDNVGAGNRVRRVDVGGTITTVAGGGPDPDVLGDGGQGSEATIGTPYGMDVGPDGALYFAERRSGGHVVRRVGAGRHHHHVRGPSATRPASTAGTAAPPRRRPARRSASRPHPTARLRRHHGTQNFTGFVRRISRPLPIGDGGAGLVPSPDGAQAFAFDAAGRHVRTVDGVTGGTLLTFGYDSAGRLESGHRRRRERDADRAHRRRADCDRGARRPADGAGGGRQRLALDASRTPRAPSREPRTARRADGDVHRPARRHPPIRVRRLGLLTRDEAPDGGVTGWRASIAGGYRVTRTTEPGREQVYEVQSRPEGGTIMRSVERPARDADGLAPGRQADRDLPRRGRGRDGAGPDPQWDFYVPALESMRVETPDGLTRITTLRARATLADPRDPFSFPTLAETAVTNGRTTTHASTARPAR